MTRCCKCKKELKGIYVDDGEGTWFALLVQDEEADNLVDVAICVDCVGRLEAWFNE